MPSRPNSESERPAAVGDGAAGGTPPGRIATSRRDRRHWPAIGVGLRIARTKVRRTARKVPEQDVYLASLIVGMLGVLVVLPLVFDASRSAGTALANGDADPIGIWWDAAALGWLALAGYAALIGVGDDGEPDEPAILAIRPAEDVAVGLTLVAAGWGALFALPLVAVAYAGLSVGVGSPFPAIGGAAAVLAALLSSGAVGYPIGIAIKGFIRRSPWLERAKPLLGGLLAVAYFGIIFSGEAGTAIDVVRPLVLDSPLSWLGDLALATTPGADASVPHAVGALAIYSLLFPLGLLAGGPAARYAWYVDRAVPTGRDADGEASGAIARLALGDRVDRALEAVTPTRTVAGVATVALRRAYREPIQLLFAAVPLVGAIPLFETLLATGSLPWWTPWAVIAYGAWVAGTTFPLNVLGVQGATLPAVLVSRARGRDVVAGTALGATILLAPITAALAVAAGIVAGRSTVTLVGIAVGAVAAVAAATVLATGIGTLAPRLDAIELSAERSAPLPSKTAYAAFSLTLVVGVIGAAALAEAPAREILAVLLDDLLPFGLHVTAPQLHAIAAIVVPLVAVAVPVSFVVAARRVERYRLG